MRTGIIGGTGLYQLDGLDLIEEVEVDTPFGRPSAPATVGRFAGREVVFLPRHGRGHRILPSEINYRANLWALKQLGATEVISVSAVGSLDEAVAPGHLGLPDQYLDRTKGRRADTFFGDGLVAHISTAEPTCGPLRHRIAAAAAALQVTYHQGGAYACVEGPRLGTRAESFFLRGAGCRFVGMTNIPEAFLAREAQLHYATIAVVTDYDCWKDDPEDHVSVATVVARYGEALAKVKRVLAAVLAAPATAPDCGCRTALAGAVLTHPEHVSPEKRAYLGFLQA
jgi:5'-methylthioadenosine phosphorylase